VNCRGRRYVEPKANMLTCSVIACAAVLSLLVLPACAKDKNPYKGGHSRSTQPAAKGRGALFTTQKMHPDRAERNAVFQDYGIPKERRKDFVVDYRVPVSLGGSNTYANIEALPRRHAELKRRVEKELLQKLRRQEITLEQAQFGILNWQSDPIAASVR